MVKTIKINLPYTFVLICVCYTFVSFFGYSRGSSPGRLLRGSLLVAGDFLGILWLLSIRRLYLTRVNKMIAIVSLLIFFIGILTIPVSWLTVKVLYPVYIIGDASWILWLFLSVIVFGVVRNKDGIHFEAIYKVYVFLAITLLLHWTGLAVYRHSFGTPHFILFSFTLSGLIVSCISHRKPFWHVAFYLIASVILLAFAFWAWSRGLFLGFIFCFVASFFMTLHFRNLKAIGIIFCILVLLSSVFYSSLAGKLDQSRFYRSFVTKEAIHGESTTNRLNEALSAQRTLQEAPGAFLTGFGHGAVYFPYVGSTSTSRNLTADGYIHNIHVGPALLFFRYGILGIILYLLCFWVLIKGLFLGRKLCKLVKYSQLTGAKEIYFSIRLFYINYFVFSILFVYSHFGNHFVNAFFGLSLAITIMFISKPSLFESEMRQLR